MKPASAPHFDLNGRVALVAGGSRGLGRAMALGFARAGDDVVIASRNGAACDEFAAEVTAETGRRALGVDAHVGRWESLDRLVDTVYLEFGKVDVLVNNASMSPLYGSVENVSEELFDKTNGVNLKGPFRLVAMVGSRMAAGDGGSIINVSTAEAVYPRPHILPYAAAKAGLNALTIWFAHTWGPTVRVNAIMADIFLTDVSRSWDAEAFARRAEGFALGRGGEAEEIEGDASSWLPRTPSYTTGSIITVDGGQP